MEADPVTDIEAVLPLAISGATRYRDNLARCEVLLASLATLAEPGLFSRILVVVPSRDYRVIRAVLSRWSRLPLELVREDEILPVMRRYPLASGWECQQLIKLAAANIVPTGFYLILGPDLILCKPLRLNAIVPDGRAILEPEPRTRHPNWWRASAALLGLAEDPTQPGMFGTPALLSPLICRQLFADLEERYRSDWPTVMLDRVGAEWTEYSLYYLTGERHGLLEKMHIEPGPGEPRLFWYATEFEHWDVDLCFGRCDPGLFTIMQANTGIAVDRVRERLRPYLRCGPGYFSRAAAWLVARGWPPTRTRRWG